MEIITTHGQLLFDACYFLAILLSGIFFLVYCHKRGYPLIACWLVFLSAMVFLIIGTKLLSYYPQEWRSFLETFHLPPHSRKTVLGGIAGGIFGIYLAQKAMRLNFPLLDAFAMALPLSMAVQRLGCFAAGCCHGIPSHVPWAVKYHAHTHAFYHHLYSQQIPPDATLSLAVHPTQLYQVILCLLIALTIYLTRDRFKRPGNLLLFSIGLYLAGRFVIEFWRDASTNHWAGSEFLGIKLVQWILILSSLTLTAYMLYRGKRPPHMAPGSLVSPRSPSWYLFMISLLVIILRDWLTPLEFLFIQLWLLPVMVMQLHVITRHLLIARTMGIPSFYALIFLLVSSAVVIAQGVSKEGEYSWTKVHSHHEVSLGYGNHQFSQYHAPPVLVSGCDGTYYSSVGPRHLHQSNAFGLGYRYTEYYNDYKKITAGGNVSMGWASDRIRIPNRDLFIFDLNPDVKLDFKYLGLASGFHFGRSITERKQGGIKYATVFEPQGHLSFSGSLRLLPVHIIYIRLGFNEFFPYQTGFRAAEGVCIAAGSGFGAKNGSKLELGYSALAGMYMSAALIFQKQFGVHAHVYNLDGDSPGDPRNYWRIGLSARLNNK